MKANPYIALYLSLCISFNPVYGADLEVDTAVSTSNQPSLDVAPNGVPIVDIVAPTAQGLSHNKFKNYNVNPQGLILNNSKVVTETQLAGYISYNKNLTGNNASLILNEVTGTNRSLLRGYTEVAGVAADVIVANPNGITVNGGGFINTPRATLTTGDPVFDESRLQSFEVNQGDILIEGAGLNADNIDQVDLYAKAVQLNAKIYAQKLNIIAGENEIGLDGSVTAKEKVDTGVALDSSALGGIYANTITLVSSDKGVGVNLPPEVFAEERLTINANGDIVLADAKAKGKEVELDTKQKITVQATGTLEADEKLQVIADTIDNQGTLSAVKANAKVIIQAQTELNNDGDIKADNIEITTASLKNQKEIYSNTDIKLTTTSIENSNLIQANDDIEIKTTTLNNSVYGVISAADDTNINAQSITNNGVVVGEDVNITTNDITNNGALYAKDDLTVNANALINNKMIRSNDEINLLIANALNNEREGVIYSDGVMNITANDAKAKINTVTNKGLIQSGDAINITAKQLDNIAIDPEYTNKTTRSRETVSRGSSNSYDIVTTTVSTQVVTVPSDPSLILADGNINIDVETLNNFYSLIAAGGNIELLADTANNVGKIVITNTTKVTQRYRDERYCSWSGPSGACFRHKHRAAYRGTFTSTNTDRVPVINYGIQAKRSITGNLVTLNNSSSVGGILSDAEITQKESQVTALKTNSSNLQESQENLGESNQIATLALGEVPDMDALITGITTEDELTTLKDNLATLEQSLQGTIDTDKTNIASLENVLAYSKTLVQTDALKSDIATLENTLVSLKANLAKNEANMAAFRASQEAIFVTSIAPSEDEVIKPEEVVPPVADDTAKSTNVIVAAKESAETTTTAKADDTTSSTEDTDTPAEDAPTEEEKIAKQKEELLKQKDTLLKIDADVRTVIADNTSTLENLKTSGSVASLVGEFESVSNTLSAEVKIALETRVSTTKSSTNATDGLYQTNSSHSLRSTDAVTYGLDTDSSAFVAKITLPTDKFGLFIRSITPDHPFLIESNPLYTNYNTFIGSDYLMTRLIYRPENTVQRLGDDMYETTLVRDSIIKLSGQRRIGDYATDTEQYQGLMNNALSLETDLDLKLGISLSNEQIANLTKDIVWLEEQVIDGNNVLVPVVYLASVDAEKLDDGSSIFAGENLGLTTSGGVINEGAIHANGTLVVNANGIINKGGALSSEKDIKLTSSADIQSISGEIKAKGNVDLSAQGNVNVYAAQQQKEYKHDSGYQNITVEGKTSKIDAGKNVTIDAANIALVKADINANENLVLNAKNGAVTVASLEAKEQYDFRFRGGYNKGHSTKQQVSNLSGNDVSINAKNVTFQGANLDAGNSVSVETEKLALNSAVEQSYSDMRYEEKGGLFGGGYVKQDTVSKTSLTSATIKAPSISLKARDIELNASSIEANAAQITTDILKLVSENETTYENHFEDSSSFLTRTIETKGAKKATVKESAIVVKDSLIFNGEDITASLQQGEVLKTLSSQYDLSNAQIEQIKAYASSDEWHDKTTTLSGLGSIAVQAVVTYFTWGAGTAATATLQEVATHAVVASLESQLASALVTSALTGDGLNIDVNQMLKSAALAGVMGVAANTTQLGHLGQGRLVNQVAQGTVNAGVKTAVLGGSFQDNLIDQAANVAFERIGHDLYNNSKYKDILPPKSITHAIVGGTIAELKGGDFTSGAISTTASHLTAEAMVKTYLDDVVDGTMTEDELISRTKLVSSLTAGAVTKAIYPSASDNELLLSNQIGQSNVDNNSLKLVVTAAKFAKKINKIKGKITKKKLKDIGLDEIASIVDDASTIFDPNATLPEKAMAMADLALGTDLNNKKTKVASNIDKLDNKAEKLADKIDSVKTGKVDENIKVVTIDKNKYPESAQHIKEAQENGHSKILTVDRSNAKNNRKESLKGIEPKKGYDRDEYPPAMFKEGGKGASVKHIKSSDNRGAGACIGGLCRNVKDGEKVKIEVSD